MEEEREYCEVFMTLEEHDVAQDYGDSRMEEYSGSKFGGKQSPNSEVECILPVYIVGWPLARLSSSTSSSHMHCCRV